MTETPQAFFTGRSLFTLGGASLAVVVVSKSIRTLLKWDSPWPAFIVALVVCFASAHSLKVLNGPVDYLVSALNSCLLFCTALGMNETTAINHDLKGRAVTSDRQNKNVGWWSSWLK
jgi:hypothetical protein